MQKKTNVEEENEMFIEQLQKIKENNRNKMLSILESGADSQEEYEKSLLESLNTSKNYNELIEIYNI